MEWGYVAAIVAGLTIEAFFKLIKYKDSLNRNNPVSKYEPMNYMSVTQYLSGGDRKWLKYICFRTLPPLIVLFLLAAVIQTYSPSTILWVAILLATIVSVLFRDLKMLFSKKKMISEKLIHFMNIFLILLAGVSVAAIGTMYDVVWLAPSLEGLIDNLWSSLLVAMLVVLYFDATNMSARVNEKYSDETAKNNYILKSYDKIQARYGQHITEASKKHNASVPLLYAIVIFEDMNRPAVLRMIENIIVKVFGVELTVGIAQVKSKKPLTDVQSISLAAEIIKNTDISKNSADMISNELIKSKIATYNPDPVYIESVATILKCFSIYAYDLFSNKHSGR